MGQPLQKRLHSPGHSPSRDQAVSEDSAAHGEAGTVAFAALSVRNQRPSQEDAFVAQEVGSGASHFLAAVFDGHGNSDTSQFLKQHLGEAVQQKLSSSSGTSDDGEGLKAALGDLDGRIASAAAASASSGFLEGGSTACAVLITKLEVVCANCGDSRAVLCRGGEAVALSDDHKPEREDEAERVAREGGTILWNNGLRVMGVLGMTRAMGDIILRRYGISSESEMLRVPRIKEDEFVLVASDGLWGALSNKEAVDVTRKALSKARLRGFDRAAAARVAARVLVRAATSRGSRDNITVVVVDLQERELQERETMEAAPAEGAAMEQEQPVLQGPAAPPALGRPVTQEHGERHDKQQAQQGHCPSSSNLCMSEEMAAPATPEPAPPCPPVDSELVGQGAAAPVPSPAAASAVDAPTRPRTSNGGQGLRCISMPATLAAGNATGALLHAELEGKPAPPSLRSVLPEHEAQLTSVCGRQVGATAAGSNTGDASPAGVAQLRLLVRALTSPSAASGSSQQVAAAAAAAAAAVAGTGKGGETDAAQNAVQPPPPCEPRAPPAASGPGLQGLARAGSGLLSAERLLVTVVREG